MWCVGFIYGSRGCKFADEYLNARFGPCVQTRRGALYFYVFNVLMHAIQYLHICGLMYTSACNDETESSMMFMQISHESFGRFES